MTVYTNEGRDQDRACEELAAAALSAAGADDAPDAVALAAALGLSPRPGQADRARVDADATLVYQSDAPRMDRQRWVSEALAGWLLREHGLEDSRETRGLLAADLLLPRDPFFERSEQLDWDLQALRAEHYPDVFYGTFGLRIATLHPAAVSWFDRGNLRWRRVHPDFRDPLAELTRFERHLAEIAMEADTVAHPEPRIRAYPLNRRFAGALLVCDAQRLLDRL